MKRYTVHLKKQKIKIEIPLKNIFTYQISKISEV